MELNLSKERELSCWVNSNSLLFTQTWAYPHTHTHTHTRTHARTCMHTGTHVESENKFFFNTSHDHKRCAQLWCTNFTENVQNVSCLFVSLQVKLQVPFRLEIGDQTIEEVNSIMRKKSVIIKGKKMALHGEPVEPKQILEFIQHFNLSNLNLSTVF